MNILASWPNGCMDFDEIAGMIIEYLERFFNIKNSEWGTPGGKKEKRRKKKKKKKKKIQISNTKKKKKKKSLKKALKKEWLNALVNQPGTPRFGTFIYVLYSPFFSSPLFSLSFLYYSHPPPPSSGSFSIKKTSLQGITQLIIVLKINSGYQLMS